MAELMTFERANDWLSSRQNVPTALSSAELALSEQFRPAARAQAFFSARVSSSTVLEALRTEADDLARGSTDIASARMRLKTFLGRQGIPADDVARTDDPPPGVDPEEWAARKQITNLASTRRLDLILRQNAAMAHAVGRREVSLHPAVAERWPYFRYISRDDASVRPQHAALDDLVLPKDDPFWHTHTPPWDFNCRCDIEDADEDEAREAGGVGTVTESQLLNPATGQVQQILPNESGYEFDIDSALNLTPDAFDWDAIQSEQLRGIVRRQVEEIIDAGRAAAVSTGARELPLDAFSGSPPALDGASEEIISEITDGFTRVLGPSKARVGAVSWMRQRRAHVHAAYIRPIVGLRPGINDRIEFQKTYSRQARRQAAEAHGVFVRRKASRLESGRRSSYDQSPEWMRVLDATERWTVSLDSDRPLATTAAHEAGHALYFQRDLRPAWIRALDSHGVTELDRFRLSEYAASDTDECFAEAVAAHAMGRREIIPESIRYALDDVTEGLW